MVWSSRVWLAAAACALALPCLPLHQLASAQPTAQKTPVTCGTCHVGVVNAYSHAPMRHAMEPVGANPALDSHTNLTAQQNGYTYSVLTKDGKSTYTVSDGSASMTLPIRWILGQQSQTWVLEKDGHFYESLVSYFHHDDSLSTTPGDESIVPHTLTEAMGRKLSIWEVRNCFDCHASGFDPAKDMSSQQLTPGLTCERCHAGSAQHMSDAIRDVFTTVPKSLRKMDAAQTSTFCGQCHRTWEKVVREGWHGPPTVRFQPYRIANSKCFTSGDSRISCIACHDPHHQVNHNDAFYDAKCLACHSPATTTSATSAPHSKTCPVAKDKCVTCHMPKVDVAGGHAVFTDHQIRIVRPGEPYPN